MPRKHILDEALPKMLTPSQVAEIFGVDPKTVTRWAQAGRLAHTRTLGGHRRFSRETVLAKLKEFEQKSTEENEVPE